MTAAEPDDGDPGYLIHAVLHAPNGGTLAINFRHPLEMGGSPHDDAAAVLAAFLDDDVTADVVDVL